MSNYYEILGLDRSADKKEVKKAYLTLAKKYHPDVNSNNTLSEDKFKLINEAYNTLYDESKRFQYDHGLISFTATTTRPPSEPSSNKRHRTVTPEQNAQRESYKEKVKEEVKRDKKQRKKYIPYMVAGYVAAMIGVISFFVDRQSKLAAEVYKNAITNLELNNLREAQKNVIQLLDYEDYLKAEVVQAGIEVLSKKPDLALHHISTVEDQIDSEDYHLFLSDLFYYKGRALYLKGKGNAAIKAFDKALIYDNGASRFDYWKGKTYNNILFEYSKASNEYKKITATSPYFEESILLLGITLQNDRQFELSQKYLLQALNFQKYKAQANYYLGWHYALNFKSSNKACIYWEASAKQGYAEARYQYKRHCQ